MLWHGNGAARIHLPTVLLSEADVERGPWAQRARVLEVLRRLQVLVFAQATRQKRCQCSGCSEELGLLAEGRPLLRAWPPHRAWALQGRRVALAGRELKPRLRELRVGCESAVTQLRCISESAWNRLRRSLGSCGNQLTIEHDSAGKQH